MAYEGHPPTHPPTHHQPPPTQQQHPGQPHPQHPAYANSQMPNGAPSFDPAYAQPGMSHHPQMTHHPEQFHPNQSQQPQGGHVGPLPPNQPSHVTQGPEVHGQMPMSNWFEPM